MIKRAPWGHSTTRNDPIYPARAGAVCGGHGRANAWDNGLSARLETQRRRELNKPSRTETGDDLPHDDFGDHSLDRSLARTLPLRRERFDHMALVQLADRADIVVTGLATTSDTGSRNIFLVGHLPQKA